MRKLTPKQLERLRGIAVASLKVPELDRPDLGIAPEDLLVACDAALGVDACEDEGDEEERRALVERYHQSCANAWRRRRGAQVGSSRAEWLRGPGCVRLSASFLSDRSGGNWRGGVDLDLVAIHAEARRLRESPASPWISFPEDVQRGKGQQRVQVRVPREMLLGIADALVGAVSVDDAGHRFYHWENPEIPRPCSTCREVRDVNSALARIDSARAQLMSTWATTLGVPVEMVERLLFEFNALPMQVLR